MTKEIIVYDIKFKFLVDIPEHDIEKGYIDIDTNLTTKELGWYKKDKDIEILRVTSHAISLEEFVETATQMISDGVLPESYFSDVDIKIPSKDCP